MAVPVPMRFYRSRPVLLAGVCVAPLLVLGVLWWLVTQVLLVPGVPKPQTSAADVLQFIVHEKGLPRLSPVQREEFVRAQTRRLVWDAAYRQAFLAEYRTSSPEEQKAFRANLFEAFKPMVLRDGRRFDELETEARQAFLDERIVEYNRMNAFRGEARLTKDALGGAAPSSAEVLQLLIDKTSAEERQVLSGYGAALRVRIEEILANPELKTAFDARIAAPGP